MGIEAVFAVFLPLLGFLAAGIVGRFILKSRGPDFTARFAHVATCLPMLVAVALSIHLFWLVGLHGQHMNFVLAPWIDSGWFHADWAIRLDTLSAVMLVVVNGVSSMVHVYSVGYMHDDPDQPRFMAYLSLFTFFMLMLVTSADLLQMFFGWEGVGLASYLLINFWYEKDSANKASIKAFLVNRVGDLGFALGIMAVFVMCGSIQYEVMFAAAGVLEYRTFHFLWMHVNAMTCACLLLFVGAMGKSAQLGLHTWLPDAMEGPTPVSALIHAATMVTAGVFMVARLSPFFEYAPVALSIITLLGAATAFVAATIGLTQFDIKRVIAYSTMSQLGYMFFALGVSAYGAAMFHLVTHAFFKALLFLSAGSVIHALHGEQDLRRMGGLGSKLPVTQFYMWVGSLALAGIGIPGVIGFSGFYSKDIILEAAYAKGDAIGHLAYWLGVAAAFMTAFYSWRLLILAFGGKNRSDHHTFEHAHESPWIMLGPLLPLALGSVVAGWCGYDWFVGLGRHLFWQGSLLVLPGNDTIARAHHGAEWVGQLPLLLALFGIFWAYMCYTLRPAWPAEIANRAGVFYRLVFNKYYFDQAYDWLFVRPAIRLGFGCWLLGDGKIIDGCGPDGIAFLAQRAGARVARLQSGYIYHYAFAIVIGLAALMSLSHFSF